MGVASAAAAAGASLKRPENAASETVTPPSKDLLPGGAYDQFLQQQVAQDQFSGNVLLAYRGDPVLVRSYGMADRSRSIPNGPDTIFQLASVTKSMTATAVLQLVQAGKVALESTLGAYVEGFPDDIANNVTIHQLLTMTSGMDNYYYDPAWYADLPTWTTADQVLDNTMTFIRQQALLFPPGTGYSYSNSGFVVLGVIVQQVSGQPYWDYMRQHIFQGASMLLTDFYTAPQVLALLAGGQMARNYSTQRTGSRVDISGNPQYIGLPDGAGGPYTTIFDMFRFATALRNSKLLNSAFSTLMLTGKFPIAPPTDPLNKGTLPIQSYLSGYGLEDFIINDRHILSHSGAGPGVATNLDIYPELDWVGVVLQNYDLTPFGANPEFSSLVELERQLITQHQAD
jgi:CubicO group peptidase (beta-lactamase class C family)